MLQIVDLKEDHIDELIKYHTLGKTECMIFNVMNELIECCACLTILHTCLISNSSHLLLVIFIGLMISKYLKGQKDCYQR